VWSQKKFEKKPTQICKTEKTTNEGQHEFTLGTKALRQWLMGFAMVSSEKEEP